MAKTIIYLIRHAQSQQNKRYEELGSSLSSEGIKQAHLIADRLKHIHFDVILSSDLLRAKHTAEAIAFGRNMTVITSSLLRERGWGVWKEVEEKEKLKERIQELQRGLSDREKMKITVSDVESEVSAASRLETFLKTNIRNYKNKTICVVTHGHSMRSFFVNRGWAKYDELPTGSIQCTGYAMLKADQHKFVVEETWHIIKKSP